MKNAKVVYTLIAFHLVFFNCATDSVWVWEMWDLSGNLPHLASFFLWSFRSKSKRKKNNHQFTLRSRTYHNFFFLCFSFRAGCVWANMQHTSHFGLRWLGAILRSVGCPASEWFSLKILEILLERC